MTLSKRQAKIETLREELKRTNFICERKRYEALQAKLDKLENKQRKIAKQMKEAAARRVFMGLSRGEVK